jgi:hypothetical protein
MIATRKTGNWIVHLVMSVSARISGSEASPNQSINQHSLPWLLCRIALPLLLWGGNIDSAIARVTDISNGCISCHILDPGNGADYRLSTKLRRWASAGVPENVMVFARKAVAPGVRLNGKHPDVSAQLDTGTIPNLCLDCHRNHPDQAPDLGRLLHLIKYTRQQPGAGNHFLSTYRGQCVHCHTLDPSSGKMQIKSGREQGR